MPKKPTPPRLELNASGIYEIRWTEDRRTKRISTKETDLPAAQAKFAEWLARKSEPVVHSVTVAGLMESYLEEHADVVCADSRRQHDAAACIIKALGSKTISELTPEVMLAYRKAREQGKINGHPVGAGTMRRELNALVAAINHAVRHRRVTLADVPHIALPNQPPPKDLWLDEKEAQQFWDAARRLGGRHFLFVAIALETASRKHAIEVLTWDQVDLAAGLIHFQQDGQVRTKKRRVPVPISDNLRAVLEEAKACAQTEWVLLNPYSIQHAFDRVKAEAYQATQNEKFMQVTPHTLRHTWATLAARAGVPLFQVAGVLGDTLPTVMRVYAHHCPDHLRGAVNFRAQAGRNPDQQTLQQANTPSLTS